MAEIMTPQGLMVGLIVEPPIAEVKKVDVKTEKPKPATKKAPVKPKAK